MRLLELGKTVLTYKHASYLGRHQQSGLTWLHEILLCEESADVKDCVSKLPDDFC